MNTKTINDANYIDVNRNEPDWLKSARQRAWDSYSETPFPVRTDEAWRRTDVAKVRLEFDSPGDINRQPTTYDEQTQNGVFIGSFEKASAVYGELIQRYIEALPYDIADRKYVSLTRAWADGIFVYIQKNTVVEEPIRLTTTGANIAATRILIVADEGCKATIIDDCVSDGSHTASASINSIETFVLNNANIRLLHFNRLNENSVLVRREEARLQANSQYKTLTISVGGNLTKTTVKALLDGKGAYSEILGVVYATNSQHFDHHTIQHHKSSDTNSDILYKTVADNKAVSVYSGLIRIEKNAQNTNAYQSNKNLLLSLTAQAHAIPNLEIEANEVKCSHGATVAPVEEEQIFYLKSRGIDEKSAKRLIVEGWFEQALDKAADDSLHQQLHDVINAKMNLIEATK